MGCRAPAPRASAWSHGGAQPSSSEHPANLSCSAGSHPYTCVGTCWAASVSHKCPAVTGVLGVRCALTAHTGQPLGAAGRTMETCVEQGGGVPSTLQEKQERAPLLREDQRLPWTLQGAGEPRESGSFPVGLRMDSGHLHITEVSLSFAGQVVTFSAGRAF